jgi:CRP/FNR family transcriptional regulator
MKLTNVVLSDSFTDLLKGLGIKKSVKEGDIILQEHAYLNSIPIVLSGSIKVLRTDEDGREILLYYIKQGESCIMSFLGGIHKDTSKVKAIAEEDSEILFIPIHAVGMLLKDYPEWLEYIFSLYHKRFEELLDVVNAVTFKKMDQRLIDFLNKKVEITKSNVLSITHEQIASELGTARVVVSRLLKQLEEMGSVKLGRNNITVM